MIHGFDVRAVLKLTMKCVLKQSVSMILYIDSKSLYNYLVKLSTIQEKYLIVNIICLWQSYKR